ncbi:hypothetical protein TRICI_002463 [Trichomonascus ciferrii]|uniref:Transcription factor domain-containing protein n=1 Tax=Trichomonascus ciferrii TaxID=44093 RepID=A0A642V6Y0_9ASCO|nr:hypothetical protein TRICI_002463 [Trichomonascus ciferrii]
MIQRLSEIPRDQKDDIFKKVEECIGSLWCVDEDILEVPLAVGPDGRLAEPVQEARRRIHAQLYDELIEVVDGVIQANQPASVSTLAGLFLFTSISPPSKAKRVPKYTMSMIEEWLIRRVHVESTLDDPNAELRELLCSLYYLDCFVCLFTGKFPAIRPSDIFLPEEIAWEVQNTPVVGVGNALRDTSMIEHQLFESFVYSRAVIENKRTNPAFRFEAVLRMIGAFRLKYADLLSLSEVPLASISTEETVQRLIHILFFYNVVLRFWENTVTTEERNVVFDDMESFTAMTFRVRVEAVKACIDAAKTLMWCMHSGRAVVHQNNQSDTTDSIALIPAKSALQYDPGMVCVFSALAIKALKSWKSFVTDEQIVSWFGEAYRGWTISETLNVYIASLYEAAEIQEKGIVLYRYYQKDQTKPNPESKTFTKVDPANIAPTAFASVGDPFYASFQQTWDTIQLTINAMNNQTLYPSRNPDN